jgi:metal-responsive CopG/Arc/MetJ family transcriptional regulator
MNKKRMNITLPEKVAEAIAPFNNKSKFIAEAIIEKIEREKKRQLDNLLIEGYRSQKKNDKELNNEWEDITLESWDD